MKRLLLLTCLLAVVGCLLASTALAQTPWTKQVSGTTETLRGVKIVSSQVVWACGYTGTVLRTTDGGTTWEVKTPTDATYDNYSIDAADAQTAWVFGTDGSVSATGPCTIWKTTDGGTTWNAVYSNTDSYSDALKFWDANNGIALGDPSSTEKHRYVIVTTTDGGATWNQVPDANIPPADSAADEVGIVNGIDFVGNSVFFPSYGNTTDIPPRVFKSTDKGATWSVSVPVHIANSTGFTMADETRGLICNFNGEVGRTLDGWATADSITPFDAVYGLRSAYWFPGTDLIVIVGGPSSAGISGISTDAGSTWTQHAALPTGAKRLRHVRFISDGSGWAVGDGGTIVKWTAAPLVSVNDHRRQMPTEYGLGQNYPNPFNPSTTIEYSIPRAGYVELKVYDLLGREIATLDQGLHNPGTYSVVFDARRLSSGVYYYTLRSDNFVSTRSLVLMK